VKTEKNYINKMHIRHYIIISVVSNRSLSHQPAKQALYGLHRLQRFITTAPVKIPYHQSG
jgi:hypothetical protein